MRNVIVSNLVSLDGVIDEPEWSMPYTGDEQLKFKFEELKAGDAMLLGRITYEGFAESWPTMPDDGSFLPVGFAARMNSLPKYVASTTLKEPLSWNATLLKGDIAKAVTALKQQPGQDILVMGSGELIGTLMQHDLVDEFRLLVFPVVVGKGKRLFKEGIPATLKLVEAIPFSSGSVKLVYRRA
jgi:dihydrofolate reductase